MTAPPGDLNDVTRAAAAPRAAALRELSGYVRPHLAKQRVWIVAGTLLSFGASVFGLVAALLTAALLDVVANGIDRSRAADFEWSRLLDLNTMGQQASTLIWAAAPDVRDRATAVLVIGALLLAATILAVATNVLGRWCWISVRVGVQTEMRADLFAHLLDLPLAFHVRMRSGALLSRLNNDIASVAQMIPVFFHTILRTPFVLAAALVVMVRTSVGLTAVTAFAGLAYIVTNFVLGRFVRRSFVRQFAQRADIMSIGQEALLSIRVVKALGAERAEVQDMRAVLDQLIREEIRGDLLSAHIPTGLNQVLSIAAAVTVAVAGLRLVALGELTEQGLVMFVVTSLSLLATAGVLAQAVITLYILSASAARVIELWGIRSDLADGTRVVASFERELRLRGVTFGYGDAPVLRDIDLTIRKGEVIGIVGASGAGKSTLADVIMRLYDPQEGTVEIDGVDVRELTQASYRRLFGVVSQETLLFNDSVRRNIAYGRPQLGDEDVRRAAEVANAEEFIRQLPQGYDTLVGERGSRLSGGQRQRIAIARAIAARPPILVLDEATSALDSASERAVQAAIDRAIGSATAIVIAHRISTLQNADRIVVLDRGRIVEVGTHAELVARGGTYRRLWDAAQSEPVRAQGAGSAT